MQNAASFSVVLVGLCLLVVAILWLPRCFRQRLNLEQFVINLYHYRMGISIFIP